MNKYSMNDFEYRLIEIKKSIEEMLHRTRWTRPNSLFICLIFLLLFISFILLINQSNSFSCSLFIKDLRSHSNVYSTLKSKSWNFLHDEDKETHLDDLSIWCLPLGSRLDFEEYLPSSPELMVPSMINRSSTHRLPYRYSSWKSSSILSRRLSRCEHFLVMNLLLIIEKICREKEIDLIMSDGTLLGSWRHHDIIPWDDDLDLMIPSRDRTRFLQSLDEINQTFVEHYILRNERRKREYYKIFFSHTQSAGGYSWNFPFVDIFLYTTNETHLWQIADEDTMTKLEYVFPLVMRPLGELWLPAPRYPEKIFSFDPFDRCIGHFWDHRNETSIDQIDLKCEDLKEIYPFVHRSNDSNSTEILKLNETIIHTIIYS